MVYACRAAQRIALACFPSRILTTEQYLFHEYIICANLTVLLLTILVVLHSPAGVQNPIQHLWACTAVVEQLKGPLPVAVEGILSSLST